MHPVLIDPDGKELTLELDWLCPVLPCTAASSSTTPAEEAKEGPPGLSLPLLEEKKDEEPPPLAAEPKGTPAPKADLPAAELDHALTHFPKLSTCDICCQATAQRKSCRKSKPAEEAGEEDASVPKAFGDLITADHIAMLNPEEASSSGDKAALVMQDRYTRWLECYPTPEHTTHATTTAFKMFLGQCSATRAYIDGSQELKGACKAMGIVQDDATPHRPQTNGVAERAVRRVLEGTVGKWSSAPMVG